MRVYSLSFVTSTHITEQQLCWDMGTQRHNGHDPPYSQSPKEELANLPGKGEELEDFLQDKRHLHWILRTE